MDHTNHAAQTEYVGRKFTIELTVFVDVDATEEQVGELIAYEIGGGSISSDFPINECNLRDAEVIDCRANPVWKYVDWGEMVDNRRSGRSRIERTPPEPMP